MARGGARPGAGQPKKAATTPEKALPKDILLPALEAGLSPLEYMLAVMRCEDVDPARRDRMAMAAAPFVHQRAVDAAPGKKAALKDAAGKAVERFGARPPPLKVVSG